MTTDKIISIIRTKFIENLDEGLLLKQDIDPTFLKLSEYDECYYRDICHSTSTLFADKRKYIIVPDKDDPYGRLSALLLKTELTKKDKWSGRNEQYYVAYDNNFSFHFLEYWLPRVGILSAILKEAPEFIDAETITDKDLVYVNVGYRGWGYVSGSVYNNKTYDLFSVYNNNTKYYFKKTADCKPMNATFADIFIFASKQFVKLSLGKDGPIDRSPHLYRDIKKVNIANKNLLEIFFHGHYDPETIVLDDYKAALQLQNHLTELRQKRTDNKHNHGHR